MQGSDELKPRPRAAGGWPNRAKRTFAARFEPARATGLYLTVVVLLTLFFLSGFFFLAAHLGVEALGGLDRRVLARS